MHSRVYGSPIGQIQISAKSGRIIEASFCTQEQGRFSEGLDQGPEGQVLDQACQQLDEFFDGYRKRFDVPIALMGSPFQLKVWSVLLQIPYGRTLTYGDLARVIGEPGASRAVGAANAANPLAIFVPCHRVIGSDGSLTGFAGGVEAKRTLLDLEGAGASLFVGALD